jgi:hypothetical protein
MSGGGGSRRHGMVDGCVCVARRVC